MTGRKSQLEKFNAKWSKNEVDQAVIREAAYRKAIEDNDYRTKGEKVMEELTQKSSEEVFAVIARSGMEAFMKTWNNSMENVVRETIRTEIRAMVQEELQAAMSGMFKGMNEAMMGMVMSNMATMPEVTPEPVEERKPRGPLSQRMKAEEPVEEKVRTTGRGRAANVDWSDVETVKTYMFSLIQEAIEQDIDVTSQRAFKLLGGKFNTAYQKGMPVIFGKGERGKKNNRWEQLIEMYYQQ